MQAQRLTDALGQVEQLPERTKLLLAMAPGCLFGFPPPNFAGLIERVDCVTCRSMMEVVLEISGLVVELGRRMDDHRRPVRERNDARRARYERWRRVFVVGWFARMEALEEEPSCTDQQWYVGTMQRVRTLESTLVQLSARDAPHWGAEEQRESSREAIGRFLAKDCHGVYTLPSLGSP